MSVWTIDTINPIETFNLSPADKNRGSRRGGEEGRGTFFFLDGRVSVTAESPLDWRGKQHLGAHLLQLSSIHFPQQYGFSFSEEGEERGGFMICCVLVKAA